MVWHVLFTECDCLGGGKREEFGLSLEDFSCYHNAKLSQGHMIQVIGPDSHKEK